MALALEARRAAPAVGYNEDEQNVWRTVCRELAPKHEQLAIREYLEAKAAVDLPTDGVPSLDLVSDRVRADHRLALRARRRARAAARVLRLALRADLPLDPVRPPPAEPLYTPEPDIIHEVIGTGTCSRRPRSRSSIA